MYEALPGVLGNRGTRAFISGEQGNKGQILKGTGEQRQYWGTGNIRKQIFDFWGTGEQANLFQGNKGTGTPPGRASCIVNLRASQKRNLPDVQVNTPRSTSGRPKCLHGHNWIGPSI